MPDLNAEEKSSLTVMTGDHMSPARISYAKIFKPEKNDLSGKEEYSCMVLIPKSDTKTVGALKQAIKMAIKGRFGDKQPNGLRIPLRDGDKSGDGGVPSGSEAGQAPYGDHYFINCKNSRQPKLIDQKRRAVLDDNLIVSGDYVRVSVNAFGYDNKSKGVSFGLNAVQLVRKGEPLGSSFNVNNAFEELPEQENVVETADAIFE
jgi:hypothetical protein|tara:strand:+ start:901 stop:1512 length:612 start_codon:yes stop_codon:yes gene_type:complete